MKAKQAVWPMSHLLASFYLINHIHHLSDYYLRLEMEIKHGFCPLRRFQARSCDQIHKEVKLRAKGHLERGCEKGTGTQTQKYKVGTHGGFNHNNIGRLRQEDFYKFEVSIGYIGSPRATVE